MAAEEGFEPSQTESESAVLPLHNTASGTLSYVRQRYLLYRIFKKCQALFQKKLEKYRTSCIFFGLASTDGMHWQAQQTLWRMENLHLQSVHPLVP